MIFVFYDKYCLVSILKDLVWSQSLSPVNFTPLSITSIILFPLFCLTYIQNVHEVLCPLFSLTSSTPPVQSWHFFKVHAPGNIIHRITKPQDLFLVPVSAQSLYFANMLTVLPPNSDNYKLFTHHLVGCWHQLSA